MCTGILLVQISIDGIRRIYVIHEECVSSLPSRGISAKPKSMSTYKPRLCTTVNEASRFTFPSKLKRVNPRRTSGIREMGGTTAAMATFVPPAQVLPAGHAFASMSIVSRRPYMSKRLSARPPLSCCTFDRGPSSPTPDYSAIDAKPLNRIFMYLFSCRLADELGVPQPKRNETTYDTVMELVAGLNARANGDTPALTAAAVRVLDALFPKWLPPAFAAMFSRPIPRAAAWLNAVVTVGTTRWLMGPMKMAEDGSMTVEIERCRYLESSGCVGTCLNSCKLATESFFESSMGLPLYIEPNFEDYSCKFAFGAEPPPAIEQACLFESCFARCPARAAASTKSTSPPQPSRAPCVSIPQPYAVVSSIASIASTKANVSQS
jgi:hypothetical protein